MRTNIPRALRALRLRRGWRQEDLGRAAGLSRDVVHRIETAQLRGVTAGSLEQVITALGADLVVEMRWRGAQLDALIDRVHAAMVTAVADRLHRAGWLTRAEVSFNSFGDRGRCDLVAWHPGERLLVIVEVKSRLGDLQQTLGLIDVKARLGPLIASQLGRSRPRATVPALVFLDHGANRRLLRRHAALFRRYTLRGRSALAWLRRPGSPPFGLLWFESSPDSVTSRAKRPRSPAGTPRAG